MTQGLLKEKHIACANILGFVESHFVWKGKVCSEKEHLIFMKTNEKNFERVRRFILKNHSYEVPEVIALPIQEGDSKYLRWIHEMVE